MWIARRAWYFPRSARRPRSSRAPLRLRFRHARGRLTEQYPARRVVAWGAAAELLAESPTLLDGGRARLGVPPSPFVGGSGLGRPLRVRPEVPRPLGPLRWL